MGTTLAAWAPVGRVASFVLKPTALHPHNSLSEDPNLFNQRIEHPWLVAKMTVSIESIAEQGNHDDRPARQRLACDFWGQTAGIAGGHGALRIAAIAHEMAQTWCRSKHMVLSSWCITTI